MKKTFLNLLSFALVLCMALTFTACGTDENSDDKGSKKDTIVGEWTTKIDLADMVNAAFPEDVQEIVKVDKYEIVVNATFTEDGKYKATLDENALDKAIEDLKADILGDMKIYVENLLAQQGITMTFEDYFAASGQTEESLFASLSPDSVAKDFEEEGTYEIDGNKIYIIKDGEEKDADKYEIFELDDDTLTFKEAHGYDNMSEEFQKAIYPQIYTRVK